MKSWKQRASIGDVMNLDLVSPVVLLPRRLPDLSRDYTLILSDKYLVSDLQAVDNELKELEEEDETAISLLENLRSKGTSTRTRRSNEVVEEIAAGKVESYVKEKNEWVKVEQKVRSNFVVVVSLKSDGFRFLQASQKYCKNLKRLESETADEASARRQAVRDFQVAYVAFRLVSSTEQLADLHSSVSISTAETLKDDYDWKDDERDYLLRWGIFEKLAPKATVAAKPEGMLLDYSSPSQMKNP
jgi:hypothetical protein